MNKKIVEKDTILMLFMFRGDYLHDKLGHEVINLFKADNDKHYVYVVPNGHVSKDYAHRVGTILFAQHIGKSRIDIFAKATVEDGPFGGVDYSSSRKSVNPKLQEMKLLQNDVCKNIKYGGISILDVFGYNKQNDDQGILVSYQVKDFLRATAEIQFSYIENDKEANKEYEYLGTNKANSTQKTFYSPNHQESGYRKLNKIIQNQNLWEGKDSSPTVKEMRQRLQDRSFLSIVKKGNDEILYSNWLHYYLSKDQGLIKDFANQVLHISDLDEEYCECFREVEHIDILIVDTQHIIILENKIKSGISGIKDNGESQLSIYLKKAYDPIATKMKIKKPIVKAYILVPDYRYGTIDLEKSNLIKGKEYQLVRYSEIHAFFNALLTEKRNKYQYPYLEAFCNSLKRHSTIPPNDLYDDCLYTFLKTVQQLS